MVWLQFTARVLLLSVCLLLFGKALGQEEGPNYQKVVVPEGSKAVLPCSLLTKENINFKLFDWIKSPQKDEGRKEVFFYDSGLNYNNGRGGQDVEFKGRVTHFPDELKHGNASITIRNTKVTDSGNYTCDFPKLLPRQKFHIELVVELVYKDRSGDKAATPKPSVTTLNATVEQALLQCKVPGASLKSKAEWQDSAGNALPAEKTQVPEGEDHYCITLNITVNKTDHYRCVVEQEDIKHMVAAETFVFISEKVCDDSSSGWMIATWFLGAFLVFAVAVVVGLERAKFITIRRYKGSRLQGKCSCTQGNDSYKKEKESLNPENGRH